MQKSKRFPFTEQENQIIRQLVKLMGEDWEAISKRLPGRTPKQCHDRYINYLREGLKSGPWSSQEDDILINMYKAIGPKWSKMMVNLPGRSGNDIKNRWHKHLNKKISSNIEISKVNSCPSNFNFQFEDQKPQVTKLTSTRPQSLPTIPTPFIYMRSTNYSQNSSEASLFKETWPTHEPKKEAEVSQEEEPYFDFDVEFSLPNSDISTNSNDFNNSLNSAQVRQQNPLKQDNNVPPVRIVKKIDISDNGIDSYSFGSNSEFNLSSSIGWNEFEIPDYMQSLNSLDLDYDF
ncbi:hypothetical protein M9Y10_011643 [Tritrichomonas musculus]|uniref:Myb-like DNA-binding domain containing protein n=1 Tax=Tritrichomonas musculus TaxID=1915356 RepID=A0ABR2IL13_9EUKA